MSMSTMDVALGASGSQTIPAAGARHHAADHAVVVRARTLAGCQRRHAPCAGDRRSLQQAAGRLQRAERTLSRLHSSPHARSARLTHRQQAPAVRLEHHALSWHRVANVRTYVFVRTAPRQAPEYSTVTGTRVTPPAVPGVKVTYRVRTAVTGSVWARKTSITYPAALATSPSRPAASTNAPTTTTVNGSAAPTLSASGQALSWTQVDAVADYVLVRQVAGQADRYTAVRGTSVTPAAVAGHTASYRVRTAVDGSAWSVARSIAYPAAQATTTGSANGSFHVGITAGAAVNWELPFVKQLGAKSARMAFAIGTPASDIEPYVDAYSKAGIQPLLLATFDGRTPTVDEAKNLAAWAAAFGPGGTFRQGKGYADSTAVTDIEFGNETSQSYQYPNLAGDPNWANTSFFINIATQYALRFKDAQTAIQAANPNVGLLAIGDVPGRWSSWMNAIFAAVPDFGQRVAGWTVHPYGPSDHWQRDMDDALAQAHAHGAPDSIPLYATEDGIASDNGHCLSDNYGWNTCMTYDQAGAALTQTVSDMHARYGSRLHAIYLYQAHDQQDPGSTKDREGYFGSLTLSGAAKGGYTTAVQTLLSQHP